MVHWSTNPRTIYFDYSPNEGKSTETTKLHPTHAKPGRPSGTTQSCGESSTWLWLLSNATSSKRLRFSATNQSKRTDSNAMLGSVDIPDLNAYCEQFFPNCSRFLTVLLFPKHIFIIFYEIYK